MNHSPPASALALPAIGRLAGAPGGFVTEPRAADSPARGWSHRALAALRRWNRALHTRRQLADLDDRLLRDVGLTREDVAQELDKPAWRL